MATRRRAKRPALERVTPIRSWPALVAGASGTESGPGMGPSQEGTGRPPGVGDVVSRSVELGYRVIDEYIRQGQKAAQRLAQGNYGPAAWNQDVQDLGVRMVQYASDLFGVWTEMMDLAVNRGAATATGTPVPNGPLAPPRHETGLDGDVEDVHADASPTGATMIKLAIASTRPTEVALELRPEAATSKALRAHALRAVEAGKPRLDDVQFVASAVGPHTLRIRVPDDHPPGAYEGLILDAVTNRPVGVVRLVVTDADDPA